MRKPLGMILSFLLPLGLQAFDQKAVDRLLAGDKNLGGADFTNLPGSALPPGGTFTGVNFAGADFSGAYLPSRTFQGCNFSNTRFDRANLRGVGFKSSCNMANASFAGADMAGTQFESAKLNQARVTGVTCTQQMGPQFMGCDCQGLHLDGTNFNGAARFYRCDLRGVDFRSGIIQGISLEASKIASSQKTYLSTQSIRQFDTIQWVTPPTLNMKPAAAEKAEKLKLLNKPVAPPR